MRKSNKGNSFFDAYLGVKMFISKHEIAGKACIMGNLEYHPRFFFSDGGDFDTIEDALSGWAYDLSRASIIDVGSESTRLEQNLFGRRVPHVVPIMGY